MNSHGNRFQNFSDDREQASNGSQECFRGKAFLLAYDVALDETEHRAQYERQTGKIESRGMANGSPREQSISPKRHQDWLQAVEQIFRTGIEDRSLGRADSVWIAHDGAVQISDPMLLGPRFHVPGLLWSAAAELHQNPAGQSRGDTRVLE